MCEAFDTRDGWAWARGRYGEVTRAVVAGPGYLVDVVDLASREEHLLELPWHFTGEVVVEASGEWESGELPDEFVTGVERFVPEDVGLVVLEGTLGERRLRVHLAFGGELLRGEGPGRPGSAKREMFYVVRVRGRGARLVAVLESATEAPQVRAEIAAFRGTLEQLHAREEERRVREDESWAVLHRRAAPARVSVPTVGPDRRADQGPRERPTH